MSMKGDESLVEESVLTPASTIKQKCFQCIKGPANILMTLVVAACLVASCIQVANCIGKVFKPPVSTFTHFDFNDTLQYPSVTFCRDPPYKFNELAKYGLYAHPRWTSVWVTFDFEALSLEELWNQTTYAEGEYFVQLGLAGERDNIEITPTIGFMLGTCYTVKPKILSSTAKKDTGYSVLLQHSAEDIETSTSIYPPGYHVYIHSNVEPFTEVSLGGSALVDHLYVNIGEELELKLSVGEYTKLSTDGDTCSVDHRYSASECTTERLWRELDNSVGCSGPWMQSELPPCSNYTVMRNLITTYMSSYMEPAISEFCPRRCSAYLYQAFVTNRQSTTQWDHAAKSWSYRTGDANYQTQLYIYFNSMMVSVYEERYNYDWSVFLADLGGSVGFLLGLSVVGAIKILGKVWSVLVRPALRPVAGGARAGAPLSPRLSPHAQLTPAAADADHDCKRPPDHWPERKPNVY